MPTHILIGLQSTLQDNVRQAQLSCSSVLVVLLVLFCSSLLKMRPYYFGHLDAALKSVNATLKHHHLSRRLDSLTLNTSVELIHLQQCLWPLHDHKTRYEADLCVISSHWGCKVKLKRESHYALSSKTRKTKQQ